MGQANLVYSTAANDAAGMPLSLSIFADRPDVLGQLHDDAVAAGFRIAEAGSLVDLLEGEARVLGELVLVDCPAPDAAALRR